MCGNQAISRVIDPLSNTLAPTEYTLKSLWLDRVYELWCWRADARPHTPVAKAGQDWTGRTDAAPGIAKTLNSCGLSAGLGQRAGAGWHG
jgi:hypothetical protein